MTSCRWTSGRAARGGRRSSGGAGERAAALRAVGARRRGDAAAPLDLAISIWPMRMWTHNMHSGRAQGAPVDAAVPLVLRSSSCARSSVHRRRRLVRHHARARARRSRASRLLLQCGVFLFMDAQKVTAPKMRFVASREILILRFFVSFFTRQAGVIWVEQYRCCRRAGGPLGYGTTARQSIISRRLDGAPLMASSLHLGAPPPASSPRPHPRRRPGLPQLARPLHQEDGAAGARRDQDIADAFLATRRACPLLLGRGEAARAPRSPSGRRRRRRCSRASVRSAVRPPSRAEEP